jgi:hypothetical protein
MPAARPELAIEIAREGRERRRPDTLFTLGHAGDVLRQSRPLVSIPGPVSHRAPRTSSIASCVAA